ncbi:MAG: polysaccharide deacetylase family protein [Sulfurospirillaceae bacterium]|nr:polysaccharide deacetylase family protein [Sulfurospirillaceae bacterium]
MIWVTLDVEEVTDMNFNVKWETYPNIDYEKSIDQFISLSQGYRSTAFVLGSFAKKFPNIIKKLSNSGVEIACHGLNHQLVYQEDFEQWSKEIHEAKHILEDITAQKILGYRSPSWSMPFEKRYYRELAKAGFTYSSSYFPMKNYMYGNSINKKESFKVYTEYGVIEEHPVPKNLIPFSGGFYLRVLPLKLLKLLFKRTINPILYIHPYELMDQNLIKFFKNHASFNIDFFLAFYATSLAKNKMRDILKK